MKSILFPTVLLAVLMSFSCKQNIKEVKGQKYTETIKNLTKAYIGELTTSKKDELLSQKAKEIGYVDVALLYKAASLAEGIHGKNFKVVLVKLGVIPQEVVPEIKLDALPEELRKSYNDEAEEIDTKYPDCVKIAEEEGAQDAKNYFQYALNTEKMHKVLYENPMHAMDNGASSEMPKAYYVCPTCGFTLDAKGAPDVCPSCKTTKEKFLVVDKI
jgi:rubrerythrin